MFVVYNFIYRRKTTFGYGLLVKSDIWEKTEESIHKIINIQLIATATKIKETNRCTNTTILVLKQYVLTVIAYAPYLYAQYFQFWLYLKALIIANSIICLFFG